MISEAVNAFKICCKSVSPYRCVKKEITVGSSSIHIGGSSVSLDSQIVLIGFGKAVLPMISAADEQLSDKVVYGIGIAPSGSREKSVFFTKYSILECGEHNLPDEKSLVATKIVIEKMKEFDSPKTVFLFLISGGGSALLASPRNVTLSQKLQIIREMTANGADIKQLNTVRQRLSAVKGGRLLENIREGKAISLIVSDVIGDPLPFIASGPTVPPTSSLNPLEIITKLGIANTLDKEIVRALEDPSIASFPSIDVCNYIVCNNSIAVSTLYDLFRTNGFSSSILSNSLNGNASETGEMLAELALSQDTVTLKERVLQRFPDAIVNLENKKIALIFGGETTVILKGKGKGGRNQEMMLSSLIRCVRSERVAHKYLLLSCGTDGQDGPTDAAGACFSSSNVDSVDLDVAVSSLNFSDSYGFWSEFLSGACHVRTGPTGTNVMDVQILLIEYN